MSGIVAAELDALIRAALREDTGDGDRTTMWTVDPTLRGAARIVAKEPGTIAGSEPAERVFGEVDAGTTVDWERRDGDRVGPGDTVARIDGCLAAILVAERTALNFLGRLSGIATLAARFVAAVAGTEARVIDTRKTTPGWRRLEKAAVAAGGASNHRMGLYDMVLIKENHIRACGGIGAALRAVAPRATEEGLEVEIEVRTTDELREALDEAPDRILLDNMSLEALRECVREVAARPRPRPRLEASGGVDLGTIREIAETGVDYISVGAMTHSAPVLDLSLLVEGA